MLAETRRRSITEALRTSGAVTIGELESRFGVSPMTARRDLAELERRGVLRRTHGGAILPTVSAHEDSFARRLKLQVEAKRRLAEQAVGAMSAREAVFLDSSTTSYFVARRMVETRMAATVLTNSLPVMELVFHEGGGDLDLVCVGGTLRRLTRSFVGPAAVRTVLAHYADRLILSVKGLTANGVMTDAGKDPASLATFFLAVLPPPVAADCSDLAAHGLPGYGVDLTDEHHATCWRVGHIHREPASDDRARARRVAPTHAATRTIRVPVFPRLHKPSDNIAD